MLSLELLGRAIEKYGRKITRLQYEEFARENNLPGIEELEWYFDFDSGVKILTDPLFKDRKKHIKTFCFECTKFKSCRLKFKDCPYKEKIDDYFKAVIY